MKREFGQLMVNNIASTQIKSDSVYTVTTQGVVTYHVRAFDDYLHLKHAIFSRLGGISQPPFHALNLSHSVGDSPEIIKHNFELICRTVGVLSEQVVESQLVHGNDIYTINQPYPQNFAGKFDGLVTNQPDVYLYMRFADCTPLIFFDPVQKVAGLTHAGWRGTMQNAAGATVEAMVKLGCSAKDIIAVIGPAIGPCCYEVGQDVMQAANNAFANPTRFFNSNGKPNHAHFDMWAANQQQLFEAGVEQVILSNICTACRTNHFFSHRAEKGKTGRFGVIIGFKGDVA